MKIKKGRISYSRERARLSTVQLKRYGEYVGRHYVGGKYVFYYVRLFLA